MTRERIRAQRGMTLMTVCLLLVSFMGLAALCIDLGILYTARTSAQHAADAAALAGASTFVYEPLASQPTAAQNAAIAVAAANKILGQPVTITADDVAVNGRHVTVTVSRTGANSVNTFFAKALGISSAPVSVTAYAQASLNAGSSLCVKPIYIPNTVLSLLPPGQTGQAGTACGSGEVLFDSNQNLTTWAAAKLGQCALIRPTSPSDVTKQNFSAGQFFSLDFGSGANTYRCTWSSCLNNVTCGANQSLISCNKPYPVKTGDMVGPTKQGVGDLTAPGDTFVSPGEYNTANGLSDTSTQVALVPVWDNCNNPITSGTAGQTATVIGYLQMFVDGMGNAQACTGGGGGGGGNGGQFVKIHTINATGCGGGNGGAGGANGGNTPTGPLGVPVQLVKQ
jgi:Flp pilus assembly protein TadG